MKAISTSSLEPSTINHIVQYFNAKIPKSSDYIVSHFKTEQKIVVIAKSQYWLKWLYSNLLNEIR